MDLPAVIFNGSFLPDDISVIFAKDSQRKIDPVVEQRTEEAWRKVLTKAKEQGTKIWDSELYRLEDTISSNDELQLSLSVIPYRIAYCVRTCWSDLAVLGESYFPKCVFVTSVLKTADGFYVLGHLSGKYYGSRKMDLIGGSASRSELVIRAGGDLYSNIEKELDEELNIPAGCIRKNVLQGGVMSEVGSVGLVFDVELDISRQQLEEAFRQGDNDELRDLAYLTRDDYFRQLDTIGGWRTLIADITSL